MIDLLQTFDATGELSYISKHNANVALLQSWMQLLFDRTGSLALNTATTATDAMFGDESAFIGYSSYATVIKSGDATKLEVGPGFAYRYSRHQAVENTAALTTLDFAGQTAGTYYVRGAATGLPEFTNDSTDALWSVAWNGTTTLSALTRVARTVWAAEEWVGAQTSTKFAASYSTLNARLDAIEAHFAGDIGFQQLAVVPTSSQVLAKIPITRDATIPAHMVGSIFRLETAPADGSWAIIVAYKPPGLGSTDVGTVTFTVGQTESTAMSLVGGLDLEAGGELILRAPVTADSAAAGPYATIKVTR